MVRLALASVVLAAGLGFQPQSNPIKGYRSWTLETKTPVDMPARISVLCAAPPPVKLGAASPHASHVFRVFVNGKAKKAFEQLRKGSHQAVFPVGSVLLKEKYKSSPSAPLSDPSRNTKPVLLTVMIKREKGFDPEAGDWQFAVSDASAKTLDTKGLAHCRSCHIKEAGPSRVFADY